MKIKVNSVKENIVVKVVDPRAKDCEAALRWANVAPAKLAAAGFGGAPVFYCFGAPRLNIALLDANALGI